MHQVHLRQHGGIGDQIAGLAFIELFKRDDIDLHLYTKFPDIAKIFLPWCKIYTREDLVKANPAWWFEVIDVVNIHGDIAQAHRIPFVSRLVTRQQALMKTEWGPLIAKHPFTCNELGHKAAANALGRCELAHWIVGQEYKEFKFDIEGVDIGEFITVHDGFDSGHQFDVSMKSWPIDYWGDFVFHFKRMYPKIKVIQLGGPKHRQIKNVDENLAGRLSFETSLRYLKSSLIHIDGDSGLVHARHLFKNPSIVIFGPTNIRYFGYPENINIPPSFCGDCWWKKGNWMQFCPEGHPSAKCMESTETSRVLFEISKLLR